MRLTIEPAFERGLKKLPPRRAEGARRCLVKFLREPRLPSLDLRPFKGLDGYWLIDAGPGDRVMLRWLAEDHYAAVDVGPHDNILRKWNR